MKELRHLKESGKVRALGVSSHDRVRAGKLAEDSPLDLFMIRYNAAHPGAERDIFPHLAKRQPHVVAYTATRWRKLLARPKGWTGNVPTAGDCYRFCLSSPHVDVCLTGPASAQQLDENLAALERGPLSADEDTWMREFGAVVHG
jgi:aryl-alcohol dehydrogenase-like predicted oxidoreductase